MPERKIIVTQSDGDVIEHTVSNDETAREFEDLPFTRGDIVRVDVTSAD